MMMDDDKFTLGNFNNLEDWDDLDLDDDLELENEPEVVEEVKPRKSNPVEIRRLNDDEKEESGGEIALRDENYGSLSEHPTEKNDPQPSFRSPKDGTSVQEVDISLIQPNEYQPRRIFNQEKLQELSDSIAEHGIIQPLVLIPKKSGSYEILVGERRFRAAKLAGLKKVPAFLRAELTNQTKLELALIENVQRADLNPIEEAKAYQQLCDEFGLQVKEVAKRVGKSNSAVSNLMRLLKLPAEIQRALVEGKISEGQARPLLSLKDREEIMHMYNVIRDNDMKVREIENKVREMKQKKVKVREMFKTDPFIESLENILRNKLGTRVAVKKGSKGGKITIEFFSNEELNDIVDKIS